MATLASRLVLFMFAAIAAAGCVLAGPDNINDFCVADLNVSVIFDIFACKPVASVVDADFKFPLVSGVPAGRLGIALSPAFAAQFPALNTFGLSGVRFDFAKGGLVPPHSHPRASEIFYVLKGTVLSGFISSSGQLYQQEVKEGELFLFPAGLIHFQKNVGKGKAKGFSALSSQNPGVQLTANALLASTPPISDAILGQDFGLKPAEVAALRKAFAS